MKPNPFSNLELQDWMKQGFIIVAVFNLKPGDATWHVKYIYIHKIGT